MYLKQKHRYLAVSTWMSVCDKLEVTVFWPQTLYLWGWILTKWNELQSKTLADSDDHGDAPWNIKFKL